MEHIRMKIIIRIAPMKLASSSLKSRETEIHITVVFVDILDDGSSDLCKLSVFIIDLFNLLEVGWIFLNEYL
jgi:hypothetical protein